jgi:hypothetical protein
VLESQRFFRVAALADADEGDVLDFAFDNCAAAAQAYRERMPQLTELVRALSIAELEVDGRYVEAEHDKVFESFGEMSLTADDLARFPDYLVCIPPDRNDASENAGLLEMLSSGLPAKVLVQTSDLFEETSIGTGRFAFGVRSARLATAAMALGGMFVCSRRARICTRCAPGSAAGWLPGAGAVQRVLRPGSGSRRAAALPGRCGRIAVARLSCLQLRGVGGRQLGGSLLAGEQPRRDDDWPVEDVEQVDTALQRITEPGRSRSPISRCATRAIRRTSPAARAAWSEAMRPAADWLALDESEAARRIRISGHR